MKSKNQIARNVYGVEFEDLSGGEKAGITKKYNAQTSGRVAPKAVKKANTTGVMKVEFGRPGVNGVKSSLVNTGTTVQDAEKQAGLNIDYKKEGFVVKKSTHYSVGDILKVTDKVYDGDLIMIVVGVDSAY